MDTSLVIIPTYNEKENISDIIHAVLEQADDFHVLIVDDNSPDGTADIVKDLQTKFNGTLHILEREGKQGLGTAYIAGFKWALEREEYSIIYEMDADFSHDPKDLLRLRDVCNQPGVDIVVGSRYVRGGRLVNWPFDRKVLSMGASLYVRIITGMPVKDPTAGFISYTREALSSINLDEVKFVGYAFQIEMKYRGYLKGFVIREIPITFSERQKGNSKMNKSIISEAIKGVLQLRWGGIITRD